MILCPSCGEENPARFRLCGFCGTPLVAQLPAQEVRKIVSIVFCDLKGSTSLGESIDTESLREVISRYFDEMRAVLERHGGTVEKFIGDAVMAVFGLPVLHEDDALRAVRAARGMQIALEELNEDLDRRYGVRLANRIGVNTGEVVAGDAAAAQRLVTGDAVNVAARLEQAAGEFEVLMGDLTYRLVRDHVEVEAVEPLELKGKAERVPAYRLIDVVETVPAARRKTPLVGREREVAAITGELQHALTHRTCRLATVIGHAGVGKTRLVEEIIRRAQDRDAVVLQGRCLPYGDGITFWPLIEAVRQAAGIDDRDAASDALEKLELLVGVEAGDVYERVAAAVGLSDAHFPLQELFWGARKLFELLAASRPLVVVFEDVHWSEDAFLELIEHLLDAVENAPVLLVCPARPDLLEAKPDWGVRDDATRVVLEPLDDAQSEQVIDNLLGESGLADEVRSRVIDAAQGNPLFVEQLVSMLIDEGFLALVDGRWLPTTELPAAAVPPTIHALLASRLDGLEREERAVVEPASVAGYVFPVDAVRELAPDAVRDQVTAHLSSLERKQFVHPDSSRSSSEAHFKFDHALIRDTAYDALLKRARATLHEKFVQWADRVNRANGREAEYEEILGYHLEQAYRYLSDLGPLDENGRGLGADGARRLASAGRRAQARGDVGAAASLLGRATALLDALDPERVALLPDYGEALLYLGDFARAETVLDEAIEHAKRIGADGPAVSARLVRRWVLLRAGDAENWREEMMRETSEAIEVLSREGDHAGLARAWVLRGYVHGVACNFGDAAEAAARALDEAALSGDSRLQTRSATAYAAAALYGPTPIGEAIERCNEIVEQVSGDRHAAATVRSLLASLEALRGDFERARELYADARAVLEDLGLTVAAAQTAIESSRVEILAGNPEAAERELRRSYEALEAVGERYLLSTVAGLLGQALADQQRYDEADEFAATARELAAEDDVDSQALWRSVRGRVLARKERFEDAERLVKEAVDLLADTDGSLMQFGAWLALAELYELAGNRQLAQDAADAAVRLAEQKQSDVAAALARERLAEVSAGRSRDASALSP